jgi:hypothetical protein
MNNKRKKIKKKKRAKMASILSWQQGSSRPEGWRETRLERRSQPR